MERTLSSTESYSPLTWLSLIHKHDPQDRYAVTQVSHYDRGSLWPTFQPEYLILLVEKRHDSGQPHLQPTTPHTLVRVSRDICGHARPARLGLWGPTEDTVTVLGPASDVQIHDERLHHLAWALDRAPSLEVISCFIACVHYDVSQSSLLRQGCPGFVHAVLEAIHIAFHASTTSGAKHPASLVPSRHIAYLVRPGTSRIHLVAGLVAIHFTIFERAEDEMEGVLRRGEHPLSPPSWSSYVVPVYVGSVRKVANGVVMSYKTLRSTCSVDQ